MDELVESLKAAGDPTRLRLLALCAEAELSAGELVRILGQSQPRVSRHLKLLCEAGLLSRNREGPFAFFRLNRHGQPGRLALSLVAALPENDPVLLADRDVLGSVAADRAARAADYFRRNAADWDRLRSLHAPEAEIETRLLRHLGEGIGDFLDIGAGSGRVLELLAPRAASAVGLDLSRDMLAVARAKLTESHLPAELRLGDMHRLPMPNQAFDTAIMHMVLHYAERPERAIAEAARVLRPGGRLFIVDFAPHKHEALRVEHQHRHLGFSNAQIADFARAAGLKSAPVETIAGDPLTVVIWELRDAREPRRLETAA